MDQWHETQLVDAEWVHENDECDIYCQPTNKVAVDEDDEIQNKLFV